MKVTRAVVAGGLLVATVALVALIGSCQGRGGAKAGAKTGPPGAAPMGEQAKAAVRVVRAVSQPVADQLELTGSVDAYRRVTVASEVAGKVVEVHGDVGDYVTRGKLLVVVDTQMQEAQAAQAAAAVEAARANLGKAVDSVALQNDTTGITVEQARKQVQTASTQLAKAQTAARATETKVNNGVTQARVAVQSAETQLQQVRRGARDQEVAQAQAALEMAQAQFDFAKSNYEVNKRLYAEGAASGTEFGQALASYQSARGQLEQARSALSLVREGATTEQVRLAELQVQQAREQLALAEAQTDQVAMSQEDVEVARNAVRLAEDQLRMAQAGRGQVVVSSHDINAAEAGVHQAAAAHEVVLVNVRKAKVFAPLSGVVAARNTDPGDYTGVGGANGLFQLLDIARVYVSAVVSELDVAKLHVGQMGTVRADALDAARGAAAPTFAGRVDDIAPSAVMNQRNFIARVIIANRGLALKPGMFARVELTVGAPITGVVLPRDCIVEEYSEGKQIRRVYVINKSNKVEIRPVTLGSTTESLVQIASGVAQGELVVLLGQRDLEKGQEVEPQEELPPSNQPAQ